MSDLIFSTTTEDLAPDDKKIMVDGMLAYHASKGHPRKADQYSVLIKNGDDKKLIGIVMVTFLWNGMQIGTLWVDETMRGQGLGKKLMEMAEAEGRKRGATFSYTDTFTWQAPGFYQKLGYKPYGKLDNFPKGHSLTYYYKNL